jgi:transposase-like protein
MPKNYTPIEKLTIVLEGLKPNASIREICGRFLIDEQTYHHWRDLFLSGALDGLSNHSTGLTGSEP